MSFGFARAVVAVAYVSAGVPARAADVETLPPVLGATEVQASDWRSGLALDGYDPVAILLDGAARPGRVEFEAVRGGLAWRFSSAANRAAFLRDPEAFRPRVGGYDAVAAAAGRVAAADPTLFMVRDGRLYLFHTAENRDRFIADPALASLAEARWPELRRELVGG